MNILSMLYSSLSLLRRGWNRAVVSNIKKHALGSFGARVHLGTNFEASGIENVFMGDNVSIGSGCTILSTRAKVFFGNYVMTGPNLTIVSGDHRTDIIGKYMAEITDDEKLPENDQDVHIEDDVWLGANVTLLKGTTIGRGAIVSAGSVVVHDVPPYSVVGGVPAKVIKKRFSDEEILRHQSLISHNT